MASFQPCLFANEELKQWYRSVSDMSYNCQDWKSDNEIVDDKEIFTVVDCGENGARWDYDYRVRNANTSDFIQYYFTVLNM